MGTSTPSCELCRIQSEENLGISFVIEIDKKSGERLAKTLQENHGLYLKFGQFLGNFEKIIPKEIQN